MPDILTHKTLASAPGKLTGAEWDDEHSFAGGSSGQLLARDTGASDGAAWTSAPSLTDLTLSGLMKAANGSAIAPAYTFASQTALGFYRQTTDAIGITGSGGLFARFLFAHEAGQNGGKQRATLFLGTTEDVTGSATADNYSAAIYPQGARNQTGGSWGHIFLAIGRLNLTATDTATRSVQFANIEADYTDFQQSGGAVTFSDVVNTRFRFPAVGSGVTLTVAKGIDFVWPIAGMVTGTVGEYRAINLPDGNIPFGQGANVYGLWFDTNYTAHITAKNNVAITILPQGTGTLDVVRNGIASTSTATLKLTNRTAATALATVQMTPALRFEGAAWNSSASQSETDAWQIDALPATAAGATSIGLRFSRSINGAAASALVQFTSGGTVICGGLSSTAGVTSSGSTNGLGYATGAGGTVTQSASKSTGVTLNKATGQITLNNAALASDTSVSFTLTNSAIAAADLLVLNHISGGTAGAYTLTAQAGSGSATITVRNITGGSLSEALVISFAVFKGAVS